MLTESGALSRRAAILGVASTLVTTRFAFAEDSPIAHGVLANNALAKAFRPPYARNIPDVDIRGPNGTQKISDLIKGRTVVMPLWAAWCPPCLSEIPDFAKLQQKFGGPTFAIIPVMTSPNRRWTSPSIAKLFGILHATAFAPLMENRFGKKLAEDMASYKGRGYALPCNLLIDPNGRVIAREIGRLPAPDSHDGPAPKNGDPEIVARAESGQTQSLWGKLAGEEFAAAMASGFLN